VLLAEQIPEKIPRGSRDIQHDLFDLGGDVSIPGPRDHDRSQVQRLETLLDQFNSALRR